MIEQIENLKQTKAKMIVKFEEVRKKHKFEIKKIDKANELPRSKLTGYQKRDG